MRIMILSNPSLLLGFKSNQFHVVLQLIIVLVQCTASPCHLFGHRQGILIGCNSL